MASASIGRVPSWREVAAEADVVPFQLADPTPQHRWAGGFSGAGDSLEILHAVGNTEVSVTTERRSLRIPDDLLLRGMMGELARRLLHEQPAAISLPFTLEFAPERRTIDVAGTPVEFRGVALGEAWAVRATLHDGVQVRVDARGDATVARLIPCTDLDLSEFPPGC